MEVDADSNHHHIRHKGIVHKQREKERAALAAVIPFRMTFTPPTVKIAHVVLDMQLYTNSKMLWLL